MRTALVWITRLAVAAALFFGCLFLQSRAIKRTAMHNGRIFLERAYEDYQRTGVLMPSKSHAKLTLFTNSTCSGVGS